MSEARSQTRIEAELKVKITELEKELTTLEAELISMRGTLGVRKESTIAALRADTSAAHERVKFLTQAMYCLSVEALEPHDASEAKLQFETLKQAVAGYCRKNNIDPELWKNIAS